MQKFHPRYMLPPNIFTRSNTIFYSDYDTDHDSFVNAIRRGLGPYKHSFWKKGVYYEHILDIENQNCQEIMLCYYLLQQNIDLEYINLHGYRKEGQEFKLTGELSSFEILYNVLLNNTRINILFDP